jgi:hypothetical protein
MIRSNVHARKSIRIHDSKQYFALQREIYDWREEEVGSVNLKPSLKTILKKNDVILISDTGMISNQQPSITTGLRGLLCRSGSYWT